MVKTEAIKLLIDGIEGDPYDSVSPGSIAGDPEDSVSPGNMKISIFDFDIRWVWFFEGSFRPREFNLSIKWTERNKRYGICMRVNPSLIIVRPVRLIQRTWRNLWPHVRARRTLALFMGTHNRLRTDPWLDLVLTALCIPELRSLV